MAMSSLMVKPSLSPRWPRLGRLAQAFDRIVLAFADAKALALKGQQRYPYLME
jgi:hypothetical protein